MGDVRTDRWSLEHCCGVSGKYLCAVLHRHTHMVDVSEGPKILCALGWAWLGFSLMSILTYRYDLS